MPKAQTKARAPSSWSCRCGAFNFSSSTVCGKCRTPRRPLPEPDLAGETDCEDQGFTRIKDGCFVCLPEFDAKGKPIRPKIVKRRERGLHVWACEKCGGNYGLVE